MAKDHAFSSFMRNHGPMVFFGVLTLAGIVFIWTAKIWELNIAVVTGVPIVTMVTYLTISLIANGMRLHNEQAGDNLYYMGFLFTLSSLGVSLYRFVGDASIDEIVRNFGIAVTSTICGIAFRIMFNQMRRDPVDIERSVRHELAEMTRRVRSELDSSAREFSSYRRSSSQMLLEGFEEIARQAEQTGAAVQKAIEVLSKESIKPIQEASAKLAVIAQQNLTLFEARALQLNGIASEAAAKLNTATVQISTMVDGLGDAVGKVSAKIEAMKSPDEVLRIELQPALNAIEDLAKRQKTLSEANAALLDQQISRTAEALMPLHSLHTRLAEALEPLRILPAQLRQPLAPVPQVERVVVRAATLPAENLAELPITLSLPAHGAPSNAISLSGLSGVRDEPRLDPGVSQTDDITATTDSVSPFAEAVARAQPPASSDDAQNKRSWFRRW